MDKKLAMELVYDIETLMKILAIALQEGNALLIWEAITNAENDLANIRHLRGVPPPRGSNL